MPITNVLVTGANAGLGKECCRQLALLEGIEKVYLGCRNEEKAKAAKSSLEESTGKMGVFDIVLMDVAKLDSVRAAIQGLKKDSVMLDGIVLNAGGSSGVHPMEKAVGICVTNIFALNVLGHALFIDLAIKEKIFTAGTVVFSGSEGARGIPSLADPRPVLQNGAVEEFSSIADGSMDGLDITNVYNYVKLAAALWIGSLARKYPFSKCKMRFLTMSPGGTKSTNIFDPMALPTRWVFKAMFQVMWLFGKVHDLETGAKRYVDALTDEGGTNYKSGRFYASADENSITGPTSDQSAIWDVFDNEVYQDNAYTAIEKLLK
ncbi:Protochlorophyllide reductase A, chloroplastic [Seminavis robusta]|uniref:Protochlorophyllide reductase A, chloroplastic n=1 Tax=Seminavis robusta TaxID=568900 RepID=A0A9N8DU54_9STRA|nr:Protochlorophyllide reductase A, chloroplastic [Seminavis robusta]|eukprot:Sro277_g106360.1 Protochlorophyllide reductase A, chloroplastic (319) ;mRNA; r:54943-55899